MAEETADGGAKPQSGDAAAAAPPALGSEGGDTEGSPEDVEALFWLATDAFAAEKYERAIELFERYHAASQQALALFNVAQCYRQLGRCSEARAAYARYEREEPAPPEQAREWMTEFELECPESEGETTATAEPAPTSVAPGEAGATSTDVESKAASHFREPLALDQPPLNLGERPPQALDVGGLSARQVWGWSLVGAGVASGVAAVVFGAKAKGTTEEISELSERLRGTEQTFEAAGGVDLAREERLQEATAISLGAAGLLAIGTGITLILTGERDGSAVDLGVDVDSTSGRFTWGGAF